MDVSIIIINYNTKEITQRCIDSVFELTKGVSFEVILVDNASIDGSKEYFEKDNRLTYIYNDENLGFGKANNIGAKVAQGKYLFFLNSDTYFLNNALLCFFKHIKGGGNKCIGFWGVQLKDEEGKFNGNGGTFPSIRKSLMLAAHIKPKAIPYKEEPFEPYSIDYVLGADVLTSKYIFDKIGGFDEDFFMYFEESDLMRRGADLGFSCQIIYGPEIVHLEGKSTGTVSHRKRMMVEKSHLKYLSKHSTLMRYKLFLILYSFLRIPTILDFHFTMKENWEYLRMIAKNI